MNGEIILDIENLHLKELNEIIIAIENRDYAILPRRKLHGGLEFIVKPAEEAAAVYGDCEIAIMPAKPAVNSY